MVPAVDDSVGDTALAASEAALDRRFTQVPFEQTCPLLQSASFLQEAARAGAFASSAAASVTAIANLQVIRPSLSGAGSRRATHRRAGAKRQIQVASASGIVHGGVAAAMSGGGATMVRMNNASVSLESMGGADLLSATRQLVRKSHGVEAELLMHLGEIDERKLYLACAHPSMFAFCVGELGFSEDAAYNRITVARAGRRLPAVIEAARSGRVHLAGLRLLAPHLNDDNHEAVLAQAAGKSKREIEELVARLAPLPPVPVVIRMLPECPVVKWAPMPARAERPAEPTAAGAPGGTAAESGPGELGPAGAPREQAPLGDELPLGVPQPVVTNYRAVVAPLSGETFKVQFTASRSLRDKLRQAQDLLRHRVPVLERPAALNHSPCSTPHAIRAPEFPEGSLCRSS